MNTPENYIKETSIKDLIIIERPRFDDSRGYFSEIFRLNHLEETLGKKITFKQANHSLSVFKAFRGFHAEEMNKLIYITSGELMCVFVDIRKESFLKTEVLYLKAGECRGVFVPSGVANSFVVTSYEPVNYDYFNDDYYKGPTKRAFIYNDPDVNITWPYNDMIISEADQKNPTLRELFPERF